MATCKTCGVRKRRWPRSCSRCGPGTDRVDTAAAAADAAGPTGVLGWLSRLVQRALD